jgi:adenine-specific DNA methylase
MDKRFIEESFPVKEISKESAREKNIRHGHISTLHIWWARRPLASSRATNYAALIPAPKNAEEWGKKRRSIINLSKWENSLNHYLIGKAREDILEANGGKPPKVLDPFAGGGAIPLEALRLGCETYAGEYNPVAVLILKATLEYPQKYGKQKEDKKDWNFFKETRSGNPLVKDVKKWGNWVLEEVKKEIGRFYPQEEDGSIPVGYIWARTIRCQKPDCDAQIPLMRQFWLANKNNRKITLKPFVRNGKVEFEVVGQKNDFPKNFDPSRGTVSRAIAKCLVCGSSVDDKAMRTLFRKGKAGQRMIAVVLHHPKKRGKSYRNTIDRDLVIYQEAKKYLEEKRGKLMDEWGIDPVPDEEIPLMSGTFNVPIYGLTEWGDLFNSRQKLALITFMEKIRSAYKKIIETTHNEEYARVVASYLAIIFDRLADKSATLVIYNAVGEKIEHVFGRQALGMVWDYVEVNPFTNVGWPNMQDWVLEIIEHCSNSNSSSARVSQISATSITYPDNYFDAVFTDPPYYNSVPYADLSDFFYVWLKRTIGDLYPELFSTPLAPKSKEIVEMAGWDPIRYQYKDRRFFEDNLKKSFQEIHRLLKPSGIASVVYTHKSTSGWETLINSLLDSGLVITASWPVHTERTMRLRARESAALASSIYFVARKTERKQTGWYNEVKEEIKKHVHQKLEKLWQEGISGADYFVAGIGSAIEVFGKYERVMDYEGNTIRADKLLGFIRDMISDYAVRQILHDGITGELSPLTKFYILWRWTYGGSKVHFDDARKLAQSTGIDLTKEWNKGFITKEKEFIKVLGPQERDIEEFKGAKELIDILHLVLNLWKEGKSEDMKKVLAESGWGNKDPFYRVAQAISETFPKESKEKQWIDGFLSRKEKILTEMKRTEQKQLKFFMEGV